MAVDKWFMSSIEQILTATGYKIIIQTDVPSHLWMRWTLTPPKEHLTQRTKRGLPLMLEKYYCFDVYEDNEQEEDGDTLEHTFIKEPWPVCETRYFYFHGEIAGVASKSTTTIFKKHRKEPPGPPPPESPIILRPNAPGDETNLFQFPATGQNWDKVDDVVPDEMATLVRNWTAIMRRDLYRLPTPEHWGTIDKITVRSRCRRESTASGSYKELWIKSGGALSQGDLRALPTGWIDHLYSWPTRPYDGQPWEWSDIDDLQIGIEVKNGGINWAMCTQLFVEIHFTV